MITFSPKMREFPRYFYKTQESEVLVLALFYFIKLAWKFAHFGYHLGAALHRYISKHGHSELPFIKGVTQKG